MKTLATDAGASISCRHKPGAHAARHFTEFLQRQMREAVR